MLDHVFTDAIDALRQSLEKALLERIAVEERFNADVLLGDLSWETSYGLLGEGTPARVKADLGLGWPTWSQSAFRGWYLGEGLGEPPRIDVEVALRIEELAALPDVALVYAAAPDEGPELGGEALQRSGPTLEQVLDRSLDTVRAAVEVVYSGSYELHEDALADSSRIDDSVAELGGWIAAALVRLNDLPLEFVPRGRPGDG